MDDQQLLDGLTLADRGIKDGLHVQLFQVLMLFIPPAPPPKGCVLWVYKCEMGEGWGLVPTDACGDPVLRPEGPPKPHAFVSQRALLNHPDAP